MVDLDPSQDHTGYSAEHARLNNVLLCFQVSTGNPRPRIHRSPLRGCDIIVEKSRVLEPGIVVLLEKINSFLVYNIVKKVSKTSRLILTLFFDDEGDLVRQWLAVRQYFPNLL